MDLDKKTYLKWDKNAAAYFLYSFHPGIKTLNMTYRYRNKNKKMLKVLRNTELHKAL